MNSLLKLFVLFLSAFFSLLWQIFLLPGEFVFKIINLISANYELISDTIIHLIRLNFQYAFIYVYVGLFWLYFLRDQIRWPTFFPYAIFLLMFKRFIFTPSLIFIIESLDFWAGLFCYNLFMFYFLFFCLAFFDYAQKWEKAFEQKNLQLVMIEDIVITRGVQRYKYIVIFFPIVFIIISFYYFLKPFPLHIFSF
jgi:hypothetical protein